MDEADDFSEFEISTDELEEMQQQQQKQGIYLDGMAAWLD